jgi:hypothetical protein
MIELKGGPPAAIIDLYCCDQRLEDDDAIYLSGIMDCSTVDWVLNHGVEYME